MDLDFIYRVLGYVLVGAVTQHIYYAWQAHQARKAFARAMAESLREHFKAK